MISVYMTKSFKRRIVVDGVSYIVEQDHKQRTLKISLKIDQKPLYTYQANADLEDLFYHQGYVWLIKKIFKLAHIERYPLYENHVKDGA